MKNVVVIAGPSGSGKNAVIEKMLQRAPDLCTRLVTATTRTPRRGEEDGVDYHFLAREKFEAEMKSGNIPEHRFIPALGTYYGIYKPDLDEKIAAGKIVVAQVDIEGARYLKQAYQAATFFLMPESLEQFQGRLHVRNPDWTQQEFEERMRITEEELRTHAPEYDHRVVNADGSLDQAVDTIMEILRAEGYTL